MRSSRLALLCACLLCAAEPGRAAPSQAAASARDLLHKALVGSSVAFSGKQRAEVYSASGKSEAVVRVYGNGKGAVRREYATGLARGVVLLEVGRSAWERTATTNWFRLPGAHTEMLPDQAAAAILRNYDVRMGAREYLLGRPVVRLEVRHRHAYNPSETLWVEPRSGLALREMIFSPNGRVRSQSAFTALRFGPQPAQLFAAPAHAGDPQAYGPASFGARRSAAQVERETGRSVLLPRYVPPGYRVTLYGVMTTGSGRLMPAVRYSDGLSAFTVFQRGWGAGHSMARGRGRGRGFGWQGGRGAGPGGAACVGQSDLQRSVVTVTGARSNYVLVGDIAESELMRVAKSLP